MLERLKNGIIVSCQPVVGGPMDKPEIIAAYAQAALDGGTTALRIEGLANLAAVRAVTKAPIIGLVKRDLAQSDVRITPLVEDVVALAERGADIIAVDVTSRPRPVAIAELFAEIKRQDRLIMADCATIDDARAASGSGADILGTTLSGYLGGPVPSEPDFDLLAALPALNRFVVAEGRYQRPHQVARAVSLGADAVVVGSAVTRPEHITSWFVDAMARPNATEAGYG
ncbi:N-acetylmannosamine-6-phosphate 2-epimerase [Bauldia sp.]|uniref:N-acetylmannosamine-6-phosphate 2-epimerase n=1 Tax=Bauldia sp. TaxID=2575872 RepID=UPI003BA909CB